MPKKPDKKTIEAAKKNLDPKAVLAAVLNEPECAELKQGLIERGLIQEIKE